MSEPVLLQMKGIHKHFPGVHALDDMQLELRAGEVHCIIGENGAGKSTLIKILGGIYEKDAGEIFIDGKPADIRNVRDAQALGIRIIHQELLMVPEMTVAENIFLGNELSKGGVVDTAGMNERAAGFLAAFNMDIPPEARVGSLPIGQQQMVEIIKAVSFNARIIVLDEPTSSLSDKEVEALFETMRALRERGIGQLYISHRMSELQEIGDRVTVLRDGKYVATRDVHGTSNDELIALMVGREMTHYYTRTYNGWEDVVFEAKGLTNSKIHDVSFQVKKGEILGFSGLVGAGRSEVMKAIFGLDPLEKGELYLNGEKLGVSRPADAIAAGISMVPEDRKLEGIFPVQTIKFNTTLKVLHEFIRGVWVDDDREEAIVQEYKQSLAIKAPSVQTEVLSLSGGNQQKVVMASWLATRPKLLILDEPTRGIDVGAKAEIYEIINELLKAGMAIIIVSSELPEVISMSDRVAVMREGRITAVLDKSEATQEEIMRHSVMI